MNAYMIIIFTYYSYFALRVIQQRIFIIGICSFLFQLRMLKILF
jgi:hypothetical protein